MNFANTWEVVAFASKSQRDQYVAKNNGHWDGRNVWRCLAITRREVSRYAANWSLTRNEYNKPKPFSGEFWGIVNLYDDPDCLGYVQVCHPSDHYERRVF
jgi:hypothetical protein